MKHRALSALSMSSFCLASSLCVAGCDGGEDQVGVNDAMMRTAPGSEPEYAGGGCILVSDIGDLAGGGVGGPEYAMEVATQPGGIVYRFFIAPEGSATSDVTPGNGELAAELEADKEFFASGETKHLEFQTYDGVGFEVWFWGEPDCEGDPPMGPPPQAD